VRGWRAWVVVVVDVVAVVVDDGARMGALCVGGEIGLLLTTTCKDGKEREGGSLYVSRLCQSEFE